MPRAISHVRTGARLFGAPALPAPARPARLAPPPPPPLTRTQQTHTYIHAACSMFVTPWRGTANRFHLPVGGPEAFERCCAEAVFGAGSVLGRTTRVVYWTVQVQYCTPQYCTLRTPTFTMALAVPMLHAEL